MSEESSSSSRGGSRGGFRGGSRGGFRGSSRGNFRGSSRGSFRGGSSRGGSRGSFRGGSSRGRGSFRGGKDTRKYINGKQGKTDEIRRALTHRSNLRKNYFKLLEKEGMTVPQKDDGLPIDESEGSEQEEEEEDVVIESTTETKPSEGDDQSDSDEESEVDENPRTPVSEIDIIKNKVKSHEALTFQERIMLKKDRREKDKERKMQKTREKLDYMKQKNMQRRLETERIKTTKTRKGQILMGPRISSLLDKIKQGKGL